MKRIIAVMLFAVAGLVQAEPYVALGVADQSERDLTFPVAVGYSFGQAAVEVGYVRSIDSTTWTYSKLEGFRASILVHVGLGNRWSGVGVVSVYDLNRRDVETQVTPFIVGFDKQGNPIWSALSNRIEATASDRPLAVGVGLQYKAATIPGLNLRFLAEVMEASRVGPQSEVYSVMVVQGF